MLFAGAAQAWAHNSLKSSDPAKDSTLQVAPPSVTLTFSEALREGGITVTITGPDNAPASGATQVSGTVVSVPFTPTVAGAHTVAYKVVADDGDATSSSFTFTLAAAAVPTTTMVPPAPTTSVVASAATVDSPDSDPGMTWWPIVLGAVALLAVVVTVIMRRRTG
ncbi:MAG: copper resistance protein CopC [Actinomycetota bacterium]|nr:copper resistance protein CopC [Actinomycetota bacterium]